MFQSLLFTMSLSGTVVCVIYLLLYPLLNRWVSLKWRYRMLKTALVFFLVPFSEGKSQFLEMLKRVFPDWSFQHVQARQKDVIIIYPDRVCLSEHLRNTCLLLLIALAIACFLIGKQIIQYHRLMKSIRADSGKRAGVRQEQLFSEIKRELGVQRNVRFFCSKHCRSPMAAGLWVPSVIFPVWEEGQIEERLYGYMIKHELVHIRHHDLLIKFFGMLAMAVHWFNPFSYFLYYELSNISEMYCDHVVLKGEGPKERRRYGELILDLATECRQTDHSCFFTGTKESRNKKSYKRRLLEITAVRNHKTALAVMVMGMLCLAGGLTDFHYDAPSILWEHGQLQTTPEPKKEEKQPSALAAAIRHGTDKDNRFHRKKPE